MTSARTGPRGAAAPKSPVPHPTATANVRHGSARGASSQKRGGQQAPRTSAAPTKPPSAIGHGRWTRRTASASATAGARSAPYPASDQAIARRLAPRSCVPMMRR